MDTFRFVSVHDRPMSPSLPYVCSVQGMFAIQFCLEMKKITFQCEISTSLYSYGLHHTALCAVYREKMK